MRLFSGYLAVCLIATQAHGAVVKGNLEARIQCGCREVNEVYDILKVLHATQFCTSWLGITTVTYTHHTTSTALKTTAVTATSAFTTDVPTTTTTTSPYTVLSSITVLAPTSSIVTDVNTEISTTYSTTTSTVTEDLSTTTTYSIYFDPNAKMKRSPAHALPKPPKPARFKTIADKIISSACSCVAKTPTVTTTVALLTTKTSSLTRTASTTVTTVDTTQTDTTISTTISLDVTSTTPSTIITSFVTSTDSLVASTTTTTIIPTTSVVAIAYPYVQLDNFNGCTFIGTPSIQLTDYSATSLEDALNQCFPLCEQVGIRGGNGGCVAIEISQLTPGAMYTCYVTDQPNSYSNNFNCRAEPENQYPLLLQYLIY